MANSSGVVNQLPQTPSAGDLLSAEQVLIVIFVYFKVLEPALGIFGIVVNIINIVIFARIGFVESINVSFCALSVSDLLFLMCSGVVNIFLVMATYVPQAMTWVNMNAVSGYLTWYRHILFDTSTCIHTYIAVARCCCVSMPLKFKNVFTVKRALAIFSIFLTVNIASHMPLLLSHGLAWVFNPKLNITQLNTWFNDDWTFYRRINDIANRTIFPIVSLLIASVCAAILTRELIRASKRRDEMTRSSTPYSFARSTNGYKRRRLTDKVSRIGSQTVADVTRHRECVPAESKPLNTPDERARIHDNTHEIPLACDVSAEDLARSRTIEDRSLQTKPPAVTTISENVIKNFSESSPHVMSRKELQIIKAVTLVTAFLAATLLVVSINAVSQAVVPDLMSMRRFSRTFTLTSNIGYLIIHINAGVNIFIYYRFNSRFREIVLGAFPVIWFSHFRQRLDSLRR